MARQGVLNDQLKPASAARDYSQLLALHCPFAAPARRSWLAKIFGRTQPDRTSSEHVALIEQAAQTPMRSSLLAEADVHVTARPIRALTSPTAAEVEQMSRVVEPPAAARAAADDELPPHVVGRAADELFPQPIATQQPPSPQCASHINHYIPCTT
jgi:hypothetical protein